MALLLVVTAQAVADETPRVAGRTIDDYASALADDDRVITLRAIRSLGAFGIAAEQPLRKALGHDDAAVRYLAAAQLGRISGRPLENAKTRLAELAADDSSYAVRLAASYALCRAGGVDEHLPLLIEALKYPDRGTACSAADLIGGIGPDAAAAIGPLEAAYARHRPGVKGGDYHIGGAANNALRKIKGQPASAASSE